MTAFHWLMAAGIALMGPAMIGWFWVTQKAQESKSALLKALVRAVAWAGWSVWCHHVMVDRRPYGDWGLIAYGALVGIVGSWIVRDIIVAAVNRGRSSDVHA